MRPTLSVLIVAWNSREELRRTLPALTPELGEGDELIVNVEARDLGLGSGGFDLVHVNLTRGLDGPGAGEQ